MHYDSGLYSARCKEKIAVEIKEISFVGNRKNT